MTRFPKILTVTLSLIAALIAALTLTGITSSPSTSRPKSVRVVKSSSTILSGSYASDPESFGEQAVIAYLDGIARQERADAEAAAVAAQASVSNAPIISAPNTQSAPAPAAPEPPAPYVGGIHAQPFLICVRHHESDRSDVNGNGLYDGGYAAKNPGSSAAGAYQYLLSTWLSVVNLMGHPEWAGDPRDFSDDTQDQVAWWTYQNQGAGPWSGSGCQ